nr:unnamed protein product [Callosobruchus chinensis]
MLGSSYVVAGDLIGLIVPRIQEEKALLFTVYVTIRTIDNPKKKDMEYYRKLRRDLEKTINESEFHLSEVKKYKSAQENRSKLRYKNVLGSIAPRNVSHYTQILEQLSDEVDDVVRRVKDIVDKERRSHYETITILGATTFQGPANFNHISERLSNKTFSNLEADEVNFEKVNGIRAAEIIYENDTAASINGNIVFEMPVEADDVVSTVKQRSRFLESSGAHEEDEIISEETIHFPANVSVDFINGINFTEFTRHKRFTNTLSANDASLHGKIDGISPQKIVTLSTDQDIPAKLTFNTLHVIKKLNVTGTVLDEQGIAFSQNPTLLHSNILKTNVNFRDIEIEGNVVVNNDFNGASFNDILEDIVYQDTSDVAISAMKNFRKPVTVQDQLTITTDSINSVHLKSLVTKDTRQHLKLNRLNGDVTIRNLLVLGNYDGKNITTFEEELVKLTGDQYIASTLIFMDELVVKNLNVKKLNDIPHEEYYYTTGVNNIGTNIEFEDVQIDNTKVIGNQSPPDDLIDCLVGGVRLTFLIDPGSKANIISEKDWKLLDNNNAVAWDIENTPRDILKSYATGKPLTINHRFTTTISIPKEKEIITHFYVVKNGDISLLGKDVAKQLGVLKLGINAATLEKITEFKVVYKPGKFNIADSLSRLCKLQDEKPFDHEEEFHVFTIIEKNTPKAMNISEIVSESKADILIAETINKINNGSWTSNDKNIYSAFKTELSAMRPVLLRGNRIVIPQTLTKRVLELAHEGHPGETVMKRRLRAKVWWPLIDKQTEQFVKACRDCLLVSQPNRPPPMSRHKFPEGPWQCLAIDLMGPLPNKEMVLLLFGRNIRDKIPSIDDLVNTDIDEEARDNDMLNKQKGKEKEDRVRKAKPCDIQPGDKVLTLNTTTSNKLESRFLNEEFEVIGRKGNEITIKSNGKIFKRHISHVKKIPSKPNQDPNISLTIPISVQQEEDVITDQTTTEDDANTYQHEEDQVPTAKVKNLAVMESVTGISSDNGVLDSLDKRYLSITKSQNIDSDYSIKVSNVANMSADTLNGIRSILTSPSNFSSEIEEYLDQDSLQVDDLYFAKSVKVNILNNKTTSNLPYAHLRNSKAAQSNLSIEGNVYFDDLDIVLFGNTNWSSVIGDFIFRNNSDFKVKGVKTFADEQLSVEKLIQTRKLNGIFLDNILTKQGNQELKGDILMKGNVTFKDLKIKDDQNIFSELLVTNGTYFVIGDMLFSRLPRIQNLTFDGLINGRSLEKEIQRIAFTDRIREDNMTIVFEDPVNISGNVHVKRLINNISFSKAVANIVQIGGDSSITNTVVFTHPVLINESLTIDHNLITQNLFGFVLDDWMDRAILLNKGYLSGNYNFEEVTVKDDLLTEKINNISMTNIVPLNSNQSIDQLHFIEAHVISDITAVDSVNNLNLSEEFENTFLVDGDQAIESMVFENNVLIRKNLNTPLLNNKPAAKVVTTDSDQELTANYDFKTKITAQGDLKVHGLLNEINTTKWKENLLKVSGANRQQINRAFDVARNVTFEEDVDGDGLVAGLDLVELVGTVNEIKKNKFEIDRGVIYFEEWQEMIFNHSVRHTFYFEYNKNQYLLVNEDNCKSHMLVFRSFTFFPVTTVETGDISQTIVVRNGNEALYLVTNNNRSEKSGKCSNHATSAWEFEEGKLELMFTMDEGIVLLQDSLIPNTFYGLVRDGVTEFVIRSSMKSYRPIRKWIFFSENAMFLPRGMQTGLSLYTEKKMIHLNRTNSVEEISDDDDLQTVLRGSLRETPNMFISKQTRGAVITATVGNRGSSEALLVVTESDDRGTDFINIFSNPMEGNLLQRIPAHNPSSILSIDFGQRQTLLVFLENETKIQVYEYKGIQGFKWKNSAQVSGSQLFLMSLPMQSQAKTTKAIGVVDGNKIKIIQSETVGARFSDEEKCHLSL